MTAPHGWSVAIVGAGPTGLLAANLLGRYGIDCVVLDRWQGTYEQPRAVHLDDEVLRILDLIGLAEPFAAMSRPARGLRLMDRRHAVLAEFTRTQASGIHGFPQASMFDQPELENLLRGALDAQGPVTIRPNTIVHALHQQDDHVDVLFRDRLTEETGRVRARYVLGCDGANSVIRQCIGSRMKDLGFEQRWLVVDIRTASDLRQWEGVHQVCDPRRAATYMRIGRDRYRWEFRLLPHESADGFTSVASLAPLLAPWLGAVPLHSLELVRCAEYTFKAQVADRWRDRRVFLLGDAAHLTPPFIGQGLGAGLRDAANLTWRLAGVLQGTLAEPCLDRYQAERRPHARAMVRLAVAVGQAMTAGGRAGEILRQAIAPRAHVLPGLGARIVSSETPALAVAQRRPVKRRQLSGTLCPAALLADGVTDPRSAAFWLVTRTPCPTTLERRVVEAGGAVISGCPGDPVDHWLRRGRTHAALVRPDGTVEAVDHDVRRLIATLPKYPRPGGPRRATHATDTPGASAYRTLDEAETW